MYEIIMKNLRLYLDLKRRYVESTPKTGVSEQAVESLIDPHEKEMGSQICSLSTTYM